MKAYYRVTQKFPGNSAKMIMEKIVECKNLYYIAKDVEKKLTGKKKSYGLWIPMREYCSEFQLVYQFDKKKNGTIADYTLIIKRI